MKLTDSRFFKISKARFGGTLRPWERRHKKRLLSPSRVNLRHNKLVTLQKVTASLMVILISKN